MRKFRQSMRERFSRSPPRASSLASASPPGAKEPSDTGATSAANIAVDPPSTALAEVVQSNSIVPGPVAASSLVLVPSTPSPSTNNATSNPTVSVPSSAETSQANRTPPRPSQPSSSPTISVCQAIVNKAKEELDKDELASLEKAGVTDNGTNPNLMFDGAYLAAIARQKEYVSQTTVWNIGGCEIKLRDVANNVVKFLNRFEAVGDVAASFDPVHAGLPWAGVKMLLEVRPSINHSEYSNRYQIPLSNAKLMGSLLSGLEIVLYTGNRLRVYYEYLPKLPAVPARKNFEDALLKLQVMLLKFLAKAIKLYETNYLSRSWTGFWNAEDITDFDSECNIVASRADTEAGVCSQGIVLDMKAKLGELKGIKDSVARLLNSIELAKLAFADGSRFDSDAENGEPQCLHGTRVDLLRQIAEWANSSDEKCILWVKGSAGSGKSTVSRTVARTFNQNGQLGASFFFKRGGGDRANSTRFFTTIAAQLAGSFSAVVPKVLEEINRDLHIKDQNMDYLFKHLIKAPLSDCIKDASTVVLVVDALDECDGEGKISNILKLLLGAGEIKPARLRIFLTSRPEDEIIKPFQTFSKGRHREINLDDFPNTQQDISACLTNEFAKISNKPETDSSDWPGNAIIKELAKLAAPSFIFAATIWRFVADPYEIPAEQLKIIRESRFTGRLMENLDRTYLTVLERLNRRASWVDKRLENQFRKLLETIVVLRDPLSVKAITGLLGEETQDLPQEIVDLRLQRLRSVLQIPDSKTSPVRIFHLSFQDFLLDNEKRDDNGAKYWFSVDEQEAHSKIARKCLELISPERALKRDPCGFKEPGVARSEVGRQVVDEHLSSEVQYACRFWVYHIEKSEGHFCDVQAVLVFLRTHLLHWFEALGWMGRISEGVIMIITLRSLFYTYENSQLTDFLDDAYRFLLSYRSIADLSPLQLYSSALIFAPKASIIRNTFQDCIPDWILQQPKVYSDWNPILQTLEGHSGWVNSVAFSPDGKLVVSGSDDGTVRLWDAVTGAPLQTLAGHSDSVNSVGFSPDGKLVVSGSDDGTVQLWDAVMRAPLQTLAGHSSSIRSVGFSPDGKLVVSGSDDGTVQLWDAVMGAPLQTLAGHSGWVNSVAFSPDGKLVVSGSGDKSVRLWDAITGAPLQTLAGHLGLVNSVAFSPDDKLVVSGSGDGTVRLWDAMMGAPLQMLAGHSGWVNSVGFSPDGKLVVSGSDDRTVRLWDAVTGAPLQTLAGHSSSIRSVGFSPDGKLVVSGSVDGIVRLWDAVTGAPLQTLAGHSGWVNSVAFSSDGKLVVSGSDDRIVRLWDAVTGAPLQTLAGHSGSVHSVAFSPNSKLVVSGSGDKIVRLWDAVTGAPLQMLVGNSESIRSVAFSPDGKLVMSRSVDEIVRLWDAMMGAPLQTLAGHLDWINSVAFSPDDKLVDTFSVSNDWVIKGKTNILWLPPNYRATCIAVRNGAIVLGHSSGGVSFLEFKEGLKLGKAVDWAF